MVWMRSPGVNPRRTPEVPWNLRNSLITNLQSLAPVCQQHSESLVCEASEQVNHSRVAAIFEDR